MLAPLWRPLGMFDCASNAEVLTCVPAPAEWASLPRSQAEARAVGVRRYFPGWPCKNGHVAPRYTSGKGCVACIAARSIEWHKNNPEKTKVIRNNGYRKRRDNNPRKIWSYHVFAGARTRARKNGLPFDINREYLIAIAPDVCPALGCPLAYAAPGTGPQWNSASVDRIVPSRGYVPGNVVVISHRANAIKNDATAAEIAMVAAWVARSTG